jgi:hypothetical protein
MIETLLETINRERLAKVIQFPRPLPKPAWHETPVTQGILNYLAGVSFGSCAVLFFVLVAS